MFNFSDAELVMAASFARTRDSLERDVNHLSREVDKANAVIAELKQKLMIEYANSFAHKASVEALRPYAIGKPILAPTGKKFSDGDDKTNLSLVYINAFDKKCREMGIKNPEAYREN